MSTLRRYQQQGVDFLVSHPRALLGDEPGLGKTAQAIGLINSLLEEALGSFLIICPAGLRLNWLNEVRLWATGKPSVSVLTGQLVAGSQINSPLFTEIVIVSYNMLSTYHNALRQVEWEAVIVDEAHYMQSLDSQRTIEIRGGWGKAPIPTKRKIAMTGTPLRNRPINLYPILKWLEVPWATKELHFGNHYCGGEEKQFRGATNIEELNQKLKTVMLRRTKAEVLGELPPKTRQIIELDIDADTFKAAKKEEESILDEAGVSFEDVVSSLSGPQINLTDEGVVARLRRNTGEAKVKAAAAYIAEMLESHDKILVFAHHRGVITELREMIYSLTQVMPVVIVGGMTDGLKNESVEYFQNHAKQAVLIGQIEAAGVGLTLTAASLVIFVEQSWVPGDNTQAEDRLHRIGQTAENIYAQYLVLNNTLDAHIARSNVAKQAVIDAVLA